MTTQTNINPFETSYHQTTTPAEGFTIQTMQDDLASLNPKNEKGLPPINTRASATVKATQSPFSIENNTEPKQPVAIPQSSIEKKATQKIVEMPQAVSPQNSKAQNNNVFYKIIFSIIILTVILILGFGYFYYTRSIKKQSVTDPIIITETPPTLPVNQIPVTIPVEKYSSEKPNLLMFDFSQSSAEDIKTRLITLSSEIKNLSSLSSLYEFVPVDKDNNPLDFKIFATAYKINFSTAIFSKLDKTFSLFLYNDGGNIRLGFKVKTILDGKATLITEMAKQEKTLGNDISFAFLNYPVENTQGVFATSFYNTNSDLIRYSNFNPEKTLSIDYAITSTDLIIGTSKDTTRRIIENSALSGPTSNTNAPSDIVPTQVN